MVPLLCETGRFPCFESKRRWTDGSIVDRSIVRVRQLCSLAYWYDNVEWKGMRAQTKTHQMHECIIVWSTVSSHSIDYDLGYICSLEFLDHDSSKRRHETKKLGSISVTCIATLYVAKTEKETQCTKEVIT
jgi:hypothetical protein